MQSNENTSFKYVMKSRDKQIEYCYSKSYVRLVVNHRSEGTGSIKFTYFLLSWNIAKIVDREVVPF